MDLNAFFHNPNPRIYSNRGLSRSTCPQKCLPTTHVGIMNETFLRKLQRWYHHEFYGILWLDINILLWTLNQMACHKGEFRKINEFTSYIYRVFLWYSKMPGRCDSSDKYSSIQEKLGTRLILVLLSSVPVSNLYWTYAVISKPIVSKNECHWSNSALLYSIVLADPEGCNLHV